MEDLKTLRIKKQMLQIEKRKDFHQENILKNNLINKLIKNHLTKFVQKVRKIADVRSVVKKDIMQMNVQTGNNIQKKSGY
ncbi:hypothetical protein Ccrd_020780 [Cynara cardunculus var. scolymus]|uniref:Uncharacterized protein n=1 Tax=Cynara cardunculus var. scolymus TaxID=59895 RepID=A0A118K0A1_CYNCS|nr:hypothetical protein Ccrd_020780 [Cynara cardunculus var. scolymus]